MLRINERQDRLEVALSPQLHLIDRVDERIAPFLSSRGIPVDLFAVRLMLREALMNSVFHGTKAAGEDAQADQTPNRPLGIIRALVELKDTEVVLTVEDSGPGFDWSSRPKPTSPLESGGRGLALMQAYADAITFNDAGNRITLRKRYRQTPRRIAALGVT